MNLIKNIILVAGLTVVIPQSSFAGINFYKFPVPPEVEEQVNFWHRIFTKYTSKQSVVHDVDKPSIILDVIDFDLLAERFNEGEKYNKHERQRIRKKYIERYKLAISRFQNEGKKAISYGPMEERVLNVYSKQKHGLNHLFNRRINLRTQLGLSDEFERAAERAEKYLPYMEDIFRHHLVPVDLTRLAFVESMFNESALSKVGASGIWQFMPSTARRYIKVNGYIDERNSPIKATHAAAKYLRSNYEMLKSWPLAITGYNHGPSGMRRASKRLGTKNLGTIIKKYKNRTFGFASKNFYAEFLAANIVYKTKYKAPFKNRNPLQISKLKLSHPISIDQLTKKTPLNSDIIKKYNRCLNRTLFSRNKHKPLPEGYEIIVPQHIAQRIKKSIKKVASNSSSRRKRVRL